jgi:phosphoglycolate phosphatase
MSRLSGWAVFDLDGTLVDTLPEITEALNRVLASHRRKGLSKEEVMRLVGHGPSTLIERAWSKTGPKAGIHEVSQLACEYSREYRCNNPRVSQPFHGVNDGLHRLIQLGWKLGVCTNKHGVAARSLIRELGWGDWIRVVVSGEETFRKPDPRSLRLAFERMGARFGRHLFVGDSEVDLQTAQNASVEAVFLGHGYGGMGKFRTRTFDNAVEMFRWIAQSGPVRKL